MKDRPNILWMSISILYLSRSISYHCWTPTAPISIGFYLLSASVHLHPVRRVIDSGDSKSHFVVVAFPEKLNTVVQLSFFLLFIAGKTWLIWLSSTTRGQERWADLISPLHHRATCIDNFHASLWFTCTIGFWPCTQRNVHWLGVVLQNPIYM